MKKMLLVVLGVLGFMLSDVPVTLAQADCEVEAGNFIRNGHFN